MSGYTLFQMAIWSSMREELAYTTTLPSFFAAASIAAQSWSRVKYLPSWLSFSHCSSAESGGSVAGAAVAGATVAGAAVAGAAVAGAAVAGAAAGLGPQLTIRTNNTNRVINLPNFCISSSSIK